MPTSSSSRGRLVDLHTHTLASDGSDPPPALVQAAAAAGVGVLAVTDHDTTAGVAAAQQAGQRLGVQVLAGCELTTTTPSGRVVHVLAYGQGLLDLGERVQAARRGRQQRNHAIGQRLQQLTGIGHTQAAQLAGGSALSRAHFARALVAAGVVADVAEAFDRYLSAGRPAYVPAPSLPLAEVVALAASAAAVTVLAHPGRLPPHQRQRVLEEALAAGIHGIEVWHPQHPPTLQHTLARLAARHGLLTTGGSDYHGHHKPDTHLATTTTPTTPLHALQHRLATQVPAARSARRGWQADQGPQNPPTNVVPATTVGASNFRPVAGRFSDPGIDGTG